MELYKKHPKLCALWCFIEIVLYAGQLFGWSSILFVLKDEGFYLELCDIGDISDYLEVEISDISNFKETGLLNKEINNTSSAYNYSGMNNIETENVNEVILSGNSDTGADLDLSSHAQYSVDKNGMDSVVGELTRGSLGCKQQETRLNLWFSIAICTSYVACSFMGPLLRKLGMRYFRGIFLISYLVGSILLGFVTPDIPWLICPGLCCIGVAGMALYATNVQVSFLFPSMQSTVTSVFVGLYDVSTIISYLMKVSHEAGIQRKYFYSGLSVIHLVLVGTSTFFILPRDYISPESSSNHRKGDDKKKKKRREENKKFLKTSHNDETNACRSLYSCEYLLHVYWMCVQGLRFVSFLGFFGTWLEKKFQGNAMKENYYLGVFSYVTIATIITAITAGMLHDCQRRKYLDTDDFRRRRLPIILPLTLTSLMSVVITSLIFVKMEICLNFIFILFTIYRSYLFSYEITFINDVYPLASFPILFGILHSSAGLAGMLQYPLFEWYTMYPEAHVHVNIFLIVLAVSSLVHPLYIWIKCKRHKDASSKTDAIEIFI